MESAGLRLFCAARPALSIELPPGNVRNAVLSVGRSARSPEGQEHEEVVCLNCSTFLLYRVSHFGSMCLYTTFCNNLRINPRLTRRR